jgi:hypothetical protein
VKDLVKSIFHSKAEDDHWTETSSVNYHTQKIW